jgi:hypothetical protein
MLEFLQSFDGLFWLLLMLVPLVFLQRALHREIQAAFLIITRHPGVTQVIFALIFLPGVFLHELSHFFMARLLGVRTGGFSLIPHSTPEGRLQLGYVETVRAGLVRDSLIGLAPLVSGCLFVAYAGIYRLQLLPLWDILRSAQWASFWTGLGSLPGIPDFWLWFYLTIAVSSTMLPSAADRHAWLPLGLWIALLVGVAVLAGAGAWMLAHLAAPFNAFLRALAAIFGVSAVVHLMLVMPFALLHRALTRLTRLDVA